jgi:putative aldouronate transport system substrate-binding protein
MKKTKNRHKAAVATVMMLSVVLSACAGKDGQQAAGPADNKPVEISIIALQQTPEVLPADNPVLKEIEKRTNTKLNITWVPTNSYNEKLKLTLASNELADLTMVGEIFDPQVVQMATAGAFWDITPFIKDYKNMAALPKALWDNAKIQGKNYGIPRIRPLQGGGNTPMFRKDWLDKLGLPIPQTMDDIFNVAKAFTEKDPDGNGKADTIGITAEIGAGDTMGTLSWVEAAFTNTNGKWKLKDGKLVPVVFEPGAKQAIEWLKKAYDEKILIQDFGVIKNSRELVMANKAGIVAQAMNPQWLLTEAARKIDPKADMYPLPFIAGPEGKMSFEDTGVAGMHVIPKKVPEAKVKQLLAFMDYGIGDEGSDLAIYGMKDVHYTEKDGFKTATEQAKKDMVGQNILGVIFGKFEKYQRAFLTGIPKDMYERNMKIIDEREKVGKPDYSFGLISQTNITYGPDLYKKIQDTKIKVIMGKEPMSAWDDMVAKLKADAQFAKIIEEMNAAYKSK